MAKIISSLGIFNFNLPALYRRYNGLLLSRILVIIQCISIKRSLVADSGNTDLYTYNSELQLWQDAKRNQVFVPLN